MLTGPGVCACSGHNDNNYYNILWCGPNNLRPGFCHTATCIILLYTVDRVLIASIY